MDTSSEIQKIKERLDKIEAVLRGPVQQTAGITRSNKAITLPELARDKKILNGQKKIAVIVGYHEKIASLERIDVKNIKSGWKDGKFSGSYNSSLLQRAVKDGLVRDLKNGYFDLTQSGEDFFDDLISGGAQS